MEVNTGVPEQVALSGPNRVKVIMPVGLNPPASVAVSLIVPPSATEPDASVVIVGTALVTTTDSPGSLQAPVTKVLPPSLYEAMYRYVPASVVVNGAEV